MRKRSPSTDQEPGSGSRPTIGSLKANLGTLGYGAGPIIGLLAASSVGFLNPQAFENDYFVILILFFGIFWMLFYGAGPSKNDDSGKSATIKDLNPLALWSETKSGKHLNSLPKTPSGPMSD
jgi:hypothetical protein